MNLQNKKAFTLVELIVVITILAILSTIWFVSYSWYLTWVRDTNRISQLKAISEWLNLYWTNHSLPTPDSTSIKIMNWTKHIATQWYAWKNVLETITYSTEWVDPKDKTYYSYYLTRDKKYYQLMAFLEEEDNLPNISTAMSSLNLLPSRMKANAVNYSLRYPTVFWDKLWILTDENNIPIQEIESIKSAWILDIVTTTDNYISYFKNWNEYANWTWSVLSKLEEVASVWWYKCWTINDFIYCLYPSWWTVDSNCERPDVLIWKQIWAGCNSTLWDGIEFENNINSSCRNYVGASYPEPCSHIQNSSITKENKWNPTYGLDNIWWKLYLGNDVLSACESWRHVPSDEEWYNLEVALWSTDRSIDWTYSWIQNWWYSNWLGWWDHTFSDTSIVELLNIPLSGVRRYSNTNFYYRWYSTTLWSSTPNSDATGLYARRIRIGSSTINRLSFSKTYAFSVRCIKD